MTKTTGISSPRTVLPQRQEAAAGEKSTKAAVNTAWAPRPAAPQSTSYDAVAATMNQLRASLPARAFDATPALNPVGKLTTGVGARLSLSLDAFQPTMAASGYVSPYKVGIRYEDTKGYFKGANEVKVWSEIKGADGAIAYQPESLTLKRQSDGTYVGSTLVLQKSHGSVGLSSASFAFSANGKWDSDSGRNYQFRL